MNIAILGSGRMGGTLGVLFAKSGHAVTFSYARSIRKLEDLAERAGHGARAATVAEAVQGAEVILLAVHWTRLEDVLAQAGDLSGKTVVTCCVPLNASDTELVVGRTESGVEVLARKIPGARVAAAFQTTPSEVFAEVFERRKEEGARPSCVYCGDDRAAKAVAARLLADVGFAPVDAGASRVARHIEPFAMLTAELAYGTDDGPNWVYRFGRIDRVL